MTKRLFVILIAACILLAGCSKFEALFNDWSGRDKKARNSVETQQGIPWREDFDAATTTAAQGGRIVLLDFYADWCSWCKKMELETYFDPQVQRIIKENEIVCIKINTDKDKSKVETYGIKSLPTLLFADSSGKVLKRIEGFLPGPQLAQVIYSLLKSPEEIQQSAETNNLVVNGGFLNQLDGWSRNIGDLTKGASKNEIIDFPEGKSKKAFHLIHEGEGHIQYSQSIDVPGPDLIFEVTFQAVTHEGKMQAFSGSGVVQIGLRYFDDGNRVLGQTILVNYVKNLFADTSLIGVPRIKKDSYTEHYIQIEPGFHQGFALNIRQEIENHLLGIDPNTVKKILIVLWCGANHPQAGAELRATDITLKSVKNI